MSVFTWIMNAVGALAQRPMHGVALVEARAEHDETIEIAAEDGIGGVAGAGVAEHAERQFVILGKNAFGPQRGGDRNRPALGQHLQAGGGGVVLDAGAGEKSDTRAVAIRKLGQRRIRRRHAQRFCAREKAEDLDVVRRAFAGEGVMREREMNRPARL